jgi:hypothetical protein
MNPPNLSAYPLCSYFLSGYLSKKVDPTNFPIDQFPALFERYEELFKSSLEVLGLSKETLKKKSEFNFDSGHAANLEGGIAMLRVVLALQLEGFLNIALVTPTKNAPGADVTCERNGRKICVEVKAITKQSKGRTELLTEEQLYPKILDSLSKARKQLEESAARLHCSVRIFACVVNWLDQSMYLDGHDYQQIVDQLEHDEFLKGIDGVLFVTKLGQRFLYLNEEGKSTDC